MKRRDFLIKSSIAASGAIFFSNALLGASNKTLEENIILSDNEDIDAELNKPLTVIIIGAGGRGRTYMQYAHQFPNSLKIVGVSDINEFRRNAMADQFDVPAENRFGDWKEVFKTSKKADLIFICTPDHLHHAPCLKALEQGYDVMVEKPAATTEQHCKEMLAHSKKYNKIVAVCHVLRYAPYFREMKKVIDSGEIGDLLSIRHFEAIDNIHMSHSYVRGNWRNSKQSTPIILSKSCHDLDILRWFVGKRCEQVTAFGQLSYFKKENAPKESADRCLDCKLESSCTYSAKKIYHDRRAWTHVFDLKGDRAEQGEQILNYLRTSNYGRCVFKSDNDQCDHYVMNMKFEDGITVAFQIGVTAHGTRYTNVMGTKGDITGDMSTFTQTDFFTGKKKQWKQADVDGGGHGGGDLRLVRDFLLAVSQNDVSLLTSTIDASIESHVMGFKAETARLKGRIENL